MKRIIIGSFLWALLTAAPAAAFNVGDWLTTTLSTGSAIRPSAGSTTQLCLIYPGNKVQVTGSGVASGSYTWWPINKFTFSCGGYSSGWIAQTSYIQTTTAPSPVLNSVSPSTISQGTSYQSVTLYGNYFTSNSYHQFSIDSGSSWFWASDAPTSVTSTSMIVAVNNQLARTVYIRVCAAYGSSTCSSYVSVTITPTTTNYTLTVSASPSAGGSVSGGGTYAAGSSRTVSATANSGYGFVNWTQNGSVVSTSASYTFTLTANRTLVANFTPIPPALIFTATPGSITAGQSSTLNWSSTNATSCTASVGWTGAKSVSGSQVVTPSATTTYTLSCSGTGGSVVKSATVTVTPAPAPALQVTSPNGGENWAVGSVHQITWTSSNLNSSGAVYIFYWYNNGWVPVTTLAPGATSYSWTVPNTPTTSATVWIGNWVNSAWQVYDQSNQNFTIYSSGGGTPANNNFASRVSISSSGGAATGNNVGATKESGEPNHAGNSGGKSVWWTWTATAAGTVRITTVGSSFDTLLAVYTGGSVAGLAPVTSNDDDPIGGIRTSRVTFNVTSGQTYQIAVDGYNGTSGSITLNLQISPTVEGRVVLMLHGINSDPTTWRSFVDSRNSFTDLVNYRSIYDGVIRSLPVPLNDDQNVAYYAVEFGSKDTTSGYKGLNDQGGETLSASGASGGDFSDFSQLGEEVRSAVAAILDRHGNSTKIVTVAHSRGGLAVRAFLQIPQSSFERSAIVGLLTLGTPHLGSPLARVYEYLRQNPRSKNATAAADWNAADQLREPTFLGFDLGLDLRRPVTKFLADNSPLITTLGNSIGNLPPNINYGVVRFEGVGLGRLLSNYDALDQTQPDQYLQLVPFSQTAEDFLLDGRPITGFAGDGLVPNANQRYYDISGFPGRNVMGLTRTGVVHVDETKQTSSIFSVLKSLVGWWGN